LERHWRYTLQEKPLRRGKILTPLLPQTILGQISIAPSQTDPHPGKKEKKN
jgi:hypothetical protein